MDSKLKDLTFDLYGKSLYYPNYSEAGVLFDEIIKKNAYKLPKKHNCADAKVIIDIGAYIGISSVYFSHTYPNAKVIAIEPNPKALPFLRLNTQSYENISIRNVAIVSDAVSALDTKSKENRSTMYIDGDDRAWWSNGSLLVGSWTRSEVANPVEIEIYPFSNLLNEFNEIDILKVDIEGGEFDLFSSISEPLLRRVKYIAVEVHDISKNSLIFNEFELELEKKGFTLIKKNGEPENGLELHFYQRH